MPRFPYLVSGFKALRELDLSAIRNRAEAPFHIAVIGDTGVGKSTLIAQLLSGPGTGGPLHLTSVSEHGLNEELSLQPCSLVILILDASRSERPIEYRVFEKLRLHNVPMIVCYNKLDLIQDPQTLPGAVRFPGDQVVAFSASDRQSIMEKLVPALLDFW